MTPCIDLDLLYNLHNILSLGFVLHFNTVLQLGKVMSQVLFGGSISYLACLESFI